MAQLINCAEVIDLQSQNLAGRIIGHPRLEPYLIVMQDQILLGDEDVRADIEGLARYYPPEVVVVTVTEGPDGRVRSVAE